MRWTKEQKQWLVNNYKNTDYNYKYFYKNLTERFNNIFNCNVPIVNIRDHCFRLNLAKERSKYFEYTKEQEQWLKNNFDGKSYKKLAEQFNKIFNCNRDRYAIATKCRHMNITIKREEPIFYTQEQIEWLKENVEGNWFETLTELFNKKFNTIRSVCAITKTCHRYGFKNNLNKAYPIGYIRNDGKEFRYKLGNTKYYKHRFVHLPRNIVESKNEFLIKAYINNKINSKILKERIHLSNGKD